MSQTLQAAVDAALGRVVDPLLDRDLISAGLVHQREIGAGGALRLVLRLGFPVKRHAPQLRARVEAALAAVPGLGPVDLRIESRIQAHEALRGVKRLPEVRNILAVASGKGGVGKSTVAVNLALALAGEGARVGMLDADIYGPSQPRMLGVRGRPDSADGRRIRPMMAYGLQSISVGYLIEDDTPMIWRGPMVTQALTQLLKDTLWQDLDYLIVDMPPGTGDIQLTLSQQVPVSGAIIVTTPQDIATLDARKGLQMFRKVNVPVLGVIENMAVHLCPHCGGSDAVFGSGGADRIAEEYGVPLLGRLPLDRRIREQADAGRPTVVADPDGALAGHYRDAALRAAAKLSLQARDYSLRFPEIKVVND
jgi:ATP-binding protein involved in chromosome partitioning